jgi:hypothetical protein
MKPRIGMVSVMRLNLRRAAGLILLKVILTTLTAVAYGEVRASTQALSTGQATVSIR